ncbi:MAG: ABC transporter ATP-binding protein [Planctomycetes bacterium]|nr:ABC transporter ATP-binding protein [Planctomycetota bacterium]
MTDAVVSLRELVKSYGRVRALDGLTIDLAPGPVGLLGPNGAGKTTLLKLLLGLLAPDSGEARIAGQDPRTSAGRLAVRQSIGYMPEGDCLLPQTTAVELVTTLARLSGLTRDDAMTRAHEVLDYVGLDESRYRDCDGYSTGMKQRLKLAQALVHDPPILLLDEPTNGLDPKGRRHMLDLVHDLGHVQKKSLLLCSHLLPDVERCCRDVVVLQKGRVVSQGSIADMTKSSGYAVKVEFDGDAAQLAQQLERRGLSVGIQAASTWTIELPDQDCDVVFQAALEADVRIRNVVPVRATLEEAFLETLARDSRANP